MTLTWKFHQAQYGPGHWRGCLGGVAVGFVHYHSGSQGDYKSRYKGRMILPSTALPEYSVAYENTDDAKAWVQDTVNRWLASAGLVEKEAAPHD